LTKNVAQASRKEKLYQQLFFQKENLTKEIFFLLAQVFFLEKRKSVV
jgi:hypothetical protein